jgi:hypothetical protein
VRFVHLDHKLARGIERLRFAPLVTPPMGVVRHEEA